MATKSPPPADPTHSRVFALADEDDYERFYFENGYVVVDGVLNTQDVEALVDEVWTSRSLLGAFPHIRRDDPQTWGDDATACWPAGTRNFLDPIAPCCGGDVAAWNARLSEGVARVFQVLWRRLERGVDCLPVGDDLPELAGGEGSLVASVDRFGIMRPTCLAGRSRPEWRTSKNWLHWDQNPWTHPAFFGLQGFVALTDGTTTSGGFVTVPGFHHEFRKWAANNPDGSVKGCSSQTVPFPVPHSDLALQSRRQKILVPKGALLVWDSRMPHENFPNADSTFRLVQYITYKRLTAKEAATRSSAWRVLISTGLVPAAFVQRVSNQRKIALALAISTEEQDVLAACVEEAVKLPAEALDAASKFQRAFHLQQKEAATPAELLEIKSLLTSAFAANPRLKEVAAKLKAAESTYLPFWVL